MTAPLLLPTPARVEVRGDTFLAPGVRSAEGWEIGSIAPSIERALKLVRADGAPPWITWDRAPAHGAAGSYQLSVTREGVRIRAGDDEGARGALATLLQLVRAGPIPSCEIHDAPAFARRGVMLDVSRDRVPTMPQFFEIIDTLAALKFNHLQLYTEHTFAYAGHEDVWRGWSPLTPAEVRRLDAYASAHGIELAANQNCFGHMVPWLKLPRYAPLAETHGDWMFDIWPRSGPFSLCPTDPASLRFVEELLDQLLPCFTSPLVNIGCDETYDIAYGRSKEETARRGRANVYMGFVRQIADACRARGKRAQFWGDIALSHPECIQDIPSDVIALAWGYEPESPFDRWGEMLGGRREFWVCPGTSTWRTITGRTTERTGNIAAAARGGLAHGAAGFLVCDWGDSGHHQQWPVTLHALADAAQAAWNPGTPADRLAESLHLFNDASGRTTRWLDALGDADLPLRETCGALSHPTLTRLRNQTALFIDMFKQQSEQTDVGTPQAWADARDRIDALAKSPPTTKGLLADELAHTVAHAHFAACRGLARRQGDATELARLASRPHELGHEHARLWRIRSREGGLAHSLSFFKQIAATFSAPAAASATLFE
ncbi:MAG: family 20 glycosylhydrolase [Planctomycetes bacterium]|nr:family 20 glycosylhydrolase [Planctomycetota bacterium]